MAQYCINLWCCAMKIINVPKGREQYQRLIVYVPKIVKQEIDKILDSYGRASDKNYTELAQCFLYNEEIDWQIIDIPKQCRKQTSQPHHNEYRNWKKRRNRALIKSGLPDIETRYQLRRGGLLEYARFTANFTTGYEYLPERIGCSANVLSKIHLKGNRRTKSPFKNSEDVLRTCNCLKCQNLLLMELRLKAQDKSQNIPLEFIE